MQLDIITDNIYHIRGESQYETASTFMRLSEFYESTSKQFRGNYFTVEQCMDAYAEQCGNFTFFEDCVGFNVPGNIVRKFFGVFQSKLLDKEEVLFLLLSEIISTKKKFYVIGSYKNGVVVDHELAHAFFYMDPTYKRAMNEITKALPKSTHKQMCERLLKTGYIKQFQNDELQAYCSTSSMVELNRQFEGIEIPWQSILEYKKTFADTKDDKLKD